MYVRIRTCSHACICAVYLVGGGLIIEANIPVQKLEGQRGEGAYFREDTVYYVLPFDHNSSHSTFLEKAGLDN